MDENKDKLNKIRIENEIKKMKLSLEHGAIFSSSDENKLPPELESQWLNHIQQYEDAFAESKLILVYDFIGNPTYKSVNEIPENEINIELNKIVNLLSKKGIVIDTICDVDDSELYRFITEELINEKMEDIKIEGMVHHYIYEEFHPNHEHDIKTLSKEFIDEILNINLKLNPNYISITDEINTKAGLIKKEEAVKKIEEFREAFSSFKLHHFNVISIKITEATADVCFDINYTGYMENSNEEIVFSGIGNFKLKHEYSYWWISKINIPQFCL